MDTLLLDRTTWDLLADTAGNIAKASDPYSQAQDAASAIRTFSGEVYYDTTLGIPYFADVLGHLPAASWYKAQVQAAALSVPGITAAVCYLAGINDRVLSGQVQMTNAAGASIVATLPGSSPAGPVVV